MVTYYSPLQKEHQPRLEFFEGELKQYLDAPERTEIILDAIRQSQLGEVIAPADYGMAPLAAVHDADYLQYLRSAYSNWITTGGNPEGIYPDTFPVRGMNHRPTSPAALAGYYSMDLTAIIMAGTWSAAYDSAQCAINASQCVRMGASAAFALCRPPGHHAMADACGGYCFLNNAAIAAQWLCESGRAMRVAVLDIDFHHGNGTQMIFYRRSDVFYLSLHANPDRQYPYFTGAADELGEGAGSGYNLNYPLEAGIGDQRYLEVLTEACDEVKQYAPHYLVVSLGVDTYQGDPLGDFRLSSCAYEFIGHKLAQLKLPTVFIMEGGYGTQQLGHNVVGVLVGFESE